MEYLKSLPSILTGFLPLLVTVALIALLLWLVKWFFNRRQMLLTPDRRFSQQLVVLVCLALGVVAVILVLPVSVGIQNQLLTLLGLVLTAIIALSSTTFVANMMASFMLRSVNGYRAGDFIRVGEQFGRVTERGLFHTEIQTEDGDLTTLPNLYLVTHPVSVIRSTGTVVSATVSLGYENRPAQIETLLLEAAEGAGLTDPFLQVIELGDFSVTYRVAGFFKEVKRILTARSDLRRSMMERLHADGIEIVSPNFMNQRVLDPHRAVLPDSAEQLRTGREVKGGRTPETQVFDKAEEAERLENLRAEYESLQKEIKAIEDRVSQSETVEKERLEGEIEMRRIRSERIKVTLKSASTRLQGEDD